MIKVTDKYYINATPNCYVLQEKYIVQDKESKNYGEIRYRDLSYCTTIESCLNSIITDNLRNYISKEEINTVNDLKIQLVNIKELIDSFNLKN